MENQKELISRMAAIISDIAFPRRGSKEEFFSRDDFAELIQADFTLEEIESLILEDTSNED